MVQRTRRQIRAYTIFKLLVLISLAAFIAYLLLVERAFEPHSPRLPAITPPPTQFDVGEAVELSGSGEPLQRIRIFANDEPLGETVIRETGRWQFSTVELDQPGEYTIRVAPLLDDGRVQFIENPETFTITIVDPSPEPTPTPTAAATAETAATVPAPTATATATATTTTEPTPPPSPTPTTEPEPTSEPTAEAAVPTPTLSATAADITATAEITGSEPITTVLDIAAEAGQFTTLLTALETAGLTPTLATTDTFSATLFAPTDAAFAALPPDAIPALLADEEALLALLTHHLVTTTLTAADLANQSQLTMADGSTLPLSSDGETLTLGRAQVITADLSAANGTIHAIDSVLIPPQEEIVAPTIDETGVPTYEGPFLTVVGTAAPGTRLVVMINGEFYGETITNTAGEWLVEDIIDPPGEYTIIAYTLSEEGLPLAVSQSVFLAVD